MGNNIQTEIELLQSRIKELENVRTREVARINAALGDDFYDSVRVWSENVAISILKLQGDSVSLALLGVNE